MVQTPEQTRVPVDLQPQPALKLPASKLPASELPPSVLPASVLPVSAVSLRRGGKRGLMSAWPWLRAIAGAALVLEAAIYLASAGHAGAQSGLRLQAQGRAYAPDIDRRLSVLLDGSAEAGLRRDAAAGLLGSTEGVAAVSWALSTVAQDPASEPAGLTGLVAQTVLSGSDTGWLSADRDDGRLTADDQALSRALWLSAMAFNGSTRPLVRDALAWLHDQTFYETVLLKTLADPAVSSAQRVLACQVLSAWQTVDALTALAQTADDPDPLVAAAAEKAADALIGLPWSQTERAVAVGGWGAWWLIAKGWTPAQREAWFQLHRARGKVGQRRAVAVFEARLVAALREAYWALDPGQQPARLVALLDDPMDPVRGLALEIAELRIADGQAFDDALLAALRLRMADGVPAHRAKGARLLASLKDQAASVIAANRLAAYQESDPKTLSAVLQLLARVPQRQAVLPVLGMLGDDRIAQDAALFLSAAVDAGYLDPALRPQLVETVRQAMGRDDQAVSVWMSLLAKVGDESDWLYIETLLDWAEAEVRQAAAKVWAADARRPLIALARRGADASLQPTLYAVARQRGREAQALLELIKHRPAEERIPAWFEAITAMVGRVEPQAAVRAIDTFAGLHGEPVKQLLLITSVLEAMRVQAVAAGVPAAAIDAEPVDAVSAQLLFRRAMVRFAQAKHAEALGDLDQVASLGPALEPAMAEAVGLTRARCYFGLKRFDDGLHVLAALPADQLAEYGELAALVQEAMVVIDQPQDQVDPDAVSQRLANLQRLLGDRTTRPDIKRLVDAARPQLPQTGATDPSADAGADPSSTALAPQPPQPQQSQDPPDPSDPASGETATSPVTPAPSAPSAPSTP